MNISNIEYLTLEEPFDVQVRREGSFIHLAALRRDGSLGASLSFSEGRALELIDAITQVMGRA